MIDRSLAVTGVVSPSQLSALKPWSNPWTGPLILLHQHCATLPRQRCFALVGPGYRSAVWALNNSSTATPDGVTAVTADASIGGGRWLLQPCP